MPPAITILIPSPPSPIFMKSDVWNHLSLLFGGGLVHFPGFYFGVGFYFSILIQEIED